MSTITTLTGETFEERDLRAATEDLDAEPYAPGMFIVQSSDGDSEYVVDREEPACLCGDYEYHNAHCKHIRKVEMLEGDRSIPNVPDLDDDLREMIENDASGTETDEEPDVALPDGGVRATKTTLQTGTDIESDDEDEISLNRIVASVTSTTEDLSDFSFDENNPADRGEPFSSIVRCAQGTVERIAANEQNAVTDTTTDK